jgi:HPt (histidine-containing phosphotransfer) domain-containing protein
LTGIARGNPTFVTKMVGLFLQEAPAGSRNMLKAFENSDLGTIQKTAHRLKSDLDTMGVVTLKKDIREIESLAAEGERTPALWLLLQNVNTVIERVAREMELQFSPAGRPASDKAAADYS